MNPRLHICIPFGLGINFALAFIFPLCLFSLEAALRLNGRFIRILNFYIPYACTLLLPGLLCLNLGLLFSSKRKHCGSRTIKPSHILLKLLLLFHLTSLRLPDCFLRIICILSFEVFLLWPGCFLFRGRLLLLYLGFNSNYSLSLLFHS